MAKTLQAAAQRRTGLSRTIGPGAHHALVSLLSSLRGEARLSTFGRIATRHDLTGKIANTLLLDHEASADPSLVEHPIVAPVFITGLPRSGTSFLQALLAENPALRAPRAWQVAFPATIRSSAAHAARAKFGRQLAAFRRLVPELAGMHPLSADAPQECTEILAHVFLSLRFDTIYNVPSYRAWLDHVGHEGAYRFHRRFLQHLQGADRPRWLLKSPDHVAALPALSRVYPDRRLIVLHRDPFRVLASVARLTELLRRPFTRSLDRAAIGRQVVRDWMIGARTILENTRKDDVIHIRHCDLVSDPQATSARLHRRLGVPLESHAQAGIEAYLAKRPHGGYAKNRYCLADYGIGPDEIALLRREYLEAFKLPEEGERR